MRADYAWTPARHKCCGSAPGTTSTDSRFVRYQSCRLLSVSSAQDATSALSLTASCQWPTTWRQSVAQHTITSGRLDPHCNLCHVTLQRRSPGVHFQSPGLLQLSFVRRHRQLTSTTAVCMYRMLPPCGRVAVNTSHLFCRNCTGCLSDAVWTSN